jgi:hypothetical protein
MGKFRPRNQRVPNSLTRPIIRHDIFTGMG